jgi:hypothetical protein
LSPTDDAQSYFNDAILYNVFAFAVCPRFGLTRAFYPLIGEEIFDVLGTMCGLGVFKKYPPSVPTLVPKGQQFEAKLRDRVAKMRMAV